MSNIVSLESQRHAIVLSSDRQGAAATFLQNLLTNDVVRSLVDAPRPSNGRVVYAHMLNSKGRFAHDVFVYGLGNGETRSTSQADCLVMDVARESKEALIKLLRMYSLRSDVRIEDGADEFVVCASLNGDMEHGPFAAFCEDPRVGALGYRGLVRRGEDRHRDTTRSTMEGVSFLEGVPRSEQDVRSTYTKLRLSLGVAEGPREIPAGSVSLEYNLDGLHGISFDKGCYIGQELMARTHYQGHIRKRLVPFRVKTDGAGDGGGAAKYGEEIVNADGTQIGVVRADSVDGYGVALVRLAKAFGKGGNAAPGLRLDGNGRLVEPYVPAWWPKAWMASE